jgi:hypothetical protein
MGIPLKQATYLREFRPEIRDVHVMTRGVEKLEEPVERAWHREVRDLSTEMSDFNPVMKAISYGNVPVRAKYRARQGRAGARRPDNENRGALGKDLIVHLIFRM